MRLRCFSFHSVKGGVGKSTLAVLCARKLAEAGPVVLVDMDLTGTSLADVMPLRPPKLRSRSGKLVFVSDGDPPWSAEEGRALVDQRATEHDPIAKHVPFLNDALLYRSEMARRSPAHDVDPSSLSWTLEGVPHLSVLPSSALPGDLERILPLIYDDLYAGFLEARIEWLLARLINPSREVAVVFDSPPTIPGLSAVLLSLAMRLPQRIPLATDVGWAGTPAPLAEAEVSWTPVLVSSTDLQDLRATDRWLTRVPAEEQDRIHVVLNRADRSDVAELAADRRRALRGAEVRGLSGLDALTPDDSLYDGVALRPDRAGRRLFAVPLDAGLQLFRSGDTRIPDFPRGLQGLFDG